MRKILLTNDDGIDAPGLKELAKISKDFGEVVIVAPDGQRSAMSQSITIREDLMLKKVEYDVDGVTAYSLSGTPADCVKIGVECVFKEKPDWCFSGINYGFNTGYDVAYSATVACAIEARMKGIPSIAFSNKFDGLYDTCREHLHGIIEELIADDNVLLEDEIWNVNFPGCALSECKGILRQRDVAKTQIFRDKFEEEKITDTETRIKVIGNKINEAEEGTDVAAVFDNYIAIGKVKSMALIS